MLEAYHRAIVDAQYAALEERARREAWTDVDLYRDWARVYATMRVVSPAPHEYLAVVDASRYPVDPYWVGFIDPGINREAWASASHSDPRFWPWSPMPGLHGSFVLVFQGPYRTFWCRECTAPFFHYHPDRQWQPFNWSLDKVFARLREAIRRAEPPSRWRPIEREVLRQASAALGITLAEDAGLGVK